MAIVAVAVYMASVFLPMMQYNQDTYRFVPDEFYQALCCRDYRNAPLGMLGFYIGHLWCSLVGDSIMNLRLLSAIMVLSPVAVTSWWYYRRTRRGVMSLALFTVAVVGSALFTDRDYDWNTAAFLFPTLLAVTMIEWMSKRPRLGWIVGALIALSVATRITMLALLPCVLAIMYICRDRLTEGLWSALVKVAISMAVTFLAVVMLIYGNPADYIAAFNHDNIITGHTGVSVYLHSFVYWIGPVLITALPSLVICLVAPYLYRLKVGRKWLLWLILGFVVIMSVTTMKLYAAYTMLIGGFLTIGAIYYGAWFTWLLAVPVRNSLGKPVTGITTDKLIMLVVWMFPLVFCVGSDVYLLRIYVMPFIPLLMTQLVDVMPRFTRSTVVMLTLCMVPVIGFVRFKPFVHPLPLDNLDRYAHMGYLYSPGDDRLKMLYELIDRRRELEKEGKRVLVWGLERFFVDYVESDEPIVALNFFHHEERYSDEEFKRLDTIIGDYDAVLMLKDDGYIPKEYLFDYFTTNGYQAVSPTPELIYFTK